MADALKNAMKANAKQTEELAKKIYACMAIELYKDGWRDKRLENMCKSIRGVYDDLKHEDKSAVEILAEETGVELMSENSNKHWYEVPYLNGKVWDDYLEKHMNKVNKAYLVAVQLKMRDWIRPQIYATVFTALHRLYGYGDKRIADMYRRMYGFEQEKNFDAGAVIKELEELTGLTVRIDEEVVEFKKVGEA